MRAFVAAKVRAVAKAFPTQWAAKRPLTTVGALVAAEVRVPAELLATLRALIGSLVTREAGDVD